MCFHNAGYSFDSDPHISSHSVTLFLTAVSVQEKGVFLAAVASNFNLTEQFLIMKTELTLLLANASVMC